MVYSRNFWLRIIFQDEVFIDFIKFYLALYYSYSNDDDRVDLHVTCAELVVCDANSVEESMVSALTVKSRIARVLVHVRNPDLLEDARGPVSGC